MATDTSTVELASAMVQHPVDLADWLLVSPILLTMLGGAIGLMLRKKTELQPLIAIVTLVLVVASNAGLLLHVLENGVVTMVMGSWLPPFGIAFTADAMGVFFALTASVVTLCAAIYAVRSIAVSERRYGFYPFLLMLLCGVTGAFLTGDIFNLYVWFEVFLIASFGMIVLGNERPQLDGAVKYAVLNMVATTLFLITSGLLYGLVGTLNMADIAGKVKALPSAAPIFGIAALFFLAFAMKAAAFPVNYWLPASYHTPRIVVAAVFAGLLTKVGVYALLRVLLVILPEGRDWLSPVISAIAILTMLTGVFGALAQTDIRRLFGFLVIAGIGTILSGLAVGSEIALAGAIFYAAQSILVMTAIYLMVGYIYEMGGSYSMRELGGLYARSPLAATSTLILIFAIAGLPPSSGFWPKVLLVEGALRGGNNWLAATILTSSVLTTIAVGRFWAFCFWRGGPEGVEDGTLVQTGSGEANQSIPATVWLPMLVLTGLVSVIGLLPERVMQIVHQGALTLLNPESYVYSVFGAMP